MEETTLAVKTRALGKGPARRLRVAGEIPAILYGKGHQPTALSVPEKAVEQVVHSAAGMNVLINLTIDNGERVVARIRDYQADPIQRIFTHLDFQVVDLSQKIVVEVPIQFEGKAEGVKLGGNLAISRRTLELRCLPTAIPAMIQIDVSPLNIGDNIHVNDVRLPEGAEIPPHVNYTIVSVVAPQKEEAPAAPVVEGAAAVPTAGEAAAPAGATPTVGEPAPAAKGKEEKK